MPNGRIVAIVGGVAGIALVLAQYLAPAWAGFHTWQYAAALALAAAMLLGYARAAKKEEGDGGARLAIAALGASVIIAAGLASGLLGPDTRTVAGTPGTVVPLPDVGAAAFFPIADAQTIARGDAHVLLRRKDASALDLALGERRYVGATALEVAAQTAAYLEARDASGGHLTITQPTNAAFLSPVLFFPQRVTIAQRLLAADSFATPALHRQIKAFYFPKDAAGAVVAMHGVTGPAVLFAVDDDDGRLVPGGIGFAQDGRETSIAGMHLQATIGTYPALVIAAVPYPMAVGIGFAILFGGLAYAGMRRTGGIRVPERGATAADGEAIREGAT